MAEPSESGPLAERVRQALASTGMSKEAFIRKTGLSRSQLELVLEGTTKFLRPETARGYAEALGVSVHWLTTGLQSLSPSDDLPPLHEYLRETRGFDDDQIRFVRRAVDAMEAERELVVTRRQLAELRESYETGWADLAAYDRRLARPPDWPPPEGPGDE